MQYISVVKLTRCIRGINKVSTILFHAQMNRVGDKFSETASETNHDDNSAVMSDSHKADFIFFDFYVDSDTVEVSCFTAHAVELLS